MFLVKSARPNVEPGLGFPSSRARASTQQDWSTLVQVMSFALGTKDRVLTLSAEDSKHLHWHAGTSFGVNSDMRSPVVERLAWVLGNIIKFDQTKGELEESDGSIVDCP